MLTFPGDVGPKLLILSTSGGAGSETALAGIVARELAAANADVTRLSLADYPLPLMSSEPRPVPELPENAVRLARQIARHDAVLILCGERNASLPAAVKNMIDWIALAPGDAWADPSFVLATFTEGKSSQTAVGDHLRTILSAAGAGRITGTFVFRDSEIDGDEATGPLEASVSIRLRALTDMLMRATPRYLTT
jgi:chromate reductase, NAD(P)H dehydrogenase (quinone)